MSRQLSLFPEPDADTEPPATSSAEASSRETAVATHTVLATPAAADRVRGVDAATRLHNKLAGWMRESLASLVLTDNRRRIISARPVADGLAVRIHHCFSQADDAVLQTVAIFLDSRKGDTRRTIALQSIRSYFEQHRAEQAVEPRLALRPAGRCFDLNVLRDRVNRTYFDDALEVYITWGRAPRVRRRRGRGFSILLGSYTDSDRLVRIHPCLDAPEVPEYVVESVVHHEMLHAALPAEIHNGRRRLHTPEFRRRERLYRHFEAANRWLESHLSRLAAQR